MYTRTLRKKKRKEKLCVCLRLRYCSQYKNLTHVERREKNVNMLNHANGLEAHTQRKHFFHGVHVFAFMPDGKMETKSGGEVFLYKVNSYFHGFTTFQNG